MEKSLKQVGHIIVTLIGLFFITTYTFSILDPTCGQPILIKNLSLIVMGSLFLIFIFLAIKYPKDLPKKQKISVIVFTLLLISFLFIVASANEGRKKSCIAAIKANSAQIQEAAATFYSIHHNYGPAVSDCNSGMFSEDPAIKAQLAAISHWKYAKSVCNSNGKDYAISSSLPGENTWRCIDSMGAAKEIEKSLTTEVVCP